MSFEEFGPDIQHIYGVDKILSDTLSRLYSESVKKYRPSTKNDQCHVNELFVNGRVGNNEDFSH